MWKHIEPNNKSFDFYEFWVNFTCPNCNRKINFNDQSQPYECECGKEYAICLDIVEKGEDYL